MFLSPISFMWYNPTNLATSCLGAWEGMGDPCYEYWRVAPRWTRQGPLGGRKGKFFPSLCKGGSFEVSQNLGRFTSAYYNVILFIIFTQRILQCPRPQAQNYGENQCELNMFVLCGCVHLLFKLHVHIYGYFACFVFTIYFLYKVLNRPCGLHMLNSVWVESIYKIFFLGMVL